MERGWGHRWIGAPATEALGKEPGRAPMATRETTVGKARPETAGIGRGPILPVTQPAQTTASPASFVVGAIDGLLVRPLTIRHDRRGWLVELFRHDELDSDFWPRMAYASM